MCTTHAELTLEPGEGIPAWVRPADGAASEPYREACTAESFHVGVSLQAPLPAAECRVILAWIEAGAPPAAGP